MRLMCSKCSKGELVEMARVLSSKFLIFCEDVQHASNNMRFNEVHVGEMNERDEDEDVVHPATLIFRVNQENWA